MGTYDTFKNSENHEQNGITLDLGDSGKFVIARAGGGNHTYRKTLERLSKPYRRAIQARTLSIEKDTELLAKCYAECIVKSWEGVTGPDGEPLPFTQENCIKLLSDLPDLFLEIQQTANEDQLYREVIQEEDSGN